MDLPEPPLDDEAPRRKRGFPVVAVGAVVALVAGLAAAGWLASQGSGPKTTPPASEVGLIIDSTGIESGALDASRPLRCFVQGRLVGELTVAECARRNGVATNELDVGLDQAGALAAAVDPGVLPVTPAPAVVPDLVESNAAPLPEPPAAGCWRKVGDQWRRLAGVTTLNACVLTLFNGRCERAGSEAVGRFDLQDLRLVGPRVEISDDGDTYRLLARQGPNCSVQAIPEPPAG